MIDDILLNVEKLNVLENDLVIITVNENTNSNEVYSILTNFRKQLEEYKLNNMVVITTPSIRLSTLSEDELKQIGLQKIK